jgi:hypothetical protein
MGRRKGNPWVVRALAEPRAGGKAEAKAAGGGLFLAEKRCAP